VDALEWDSAPEDCRRKVEAERRPASTILHWDVPPRPAVLPGSVEP
jgi:hypothetical protein